MKTGQTKTMKSLKDQMETCDKDIAKLIKTIEDLNGMEFNTTPGQDAKGQAVQQIENEIATLRVDIANHRAKLEIATVEYITGKDTDMAPEEELVHSR